MASIISAEPAVTRSN